MAVKELFLTQNIGLNDMKGILEEKKIMVYAFLFVLLIIQKYPVLQSCCILVKQLALEID